VRAVLGEYRPEVFAVRTERSEVRTKKTEGRYSPSTVPSKLKKAKTCKKHKGGIIRDNARSDN